MTQEGIPTKNNGTSSSSLLIIREKCRLHRVFDRHDTRRRENMLLLFAFRMIGRSPLDLFPFASKTCLTPVAPSQKFCEIRAIFFLFSSK